MTDPKPTPPFRIAPIDAPTLASVRPQPPAGPTIEPYRVLFPLGAACAIAAATPWIPLAFGAAPWPGLLHASLMVQGFELCFVTGFLLTAMPSFTHGAKCRPWELATVATGALLFAALHLAGIEGWAQLAYSATLAFTATAILRRVRFDGAAPPEEFLLVAAGLLFGIAGGLHQAGAAFGTLPEPLPRFGVRLVSRGMMLSLVLGLGGLLVPTFALMKDPLQIFGIARAGQRGPRRAFVLVLAALLAYAFAADAEHLPRLAAWLRAAAALASTQLAWKLWRRPGRNDRLAWALWGSGWGIVIGIVAAAIWPAHETLAWHITFIGGYSLLTIAIATRVVVSHGGHDSGEESQVLGAGVLVLLALALVLRLLGGDVDPSRAPALAGAALLWCGARGWWLAGAGPRALRTRRAALTMPSAPKRKA